MFCELRQHYGWLVAGASFIQYFFGFGTMSSYVLLYVELEKEYQTASASALGWVAAVAWGLCSMMSVVSSPLYERFGHQKVMVVGVFLTFTGILGTTFAPNLWVMYLTFGVILGCGFNFVYNPSMNLITAYFPTMNCTRATAGATMGAPIGLLAMCPLLDIGFHTLGWRNSYRIVAGVYLFIAVPMCILMKPPDANYVKQLTESKEEKEIAAEQGQFLNPTKSTVASTADYSHITGDSCDIKKAKKHWKKYVSILKLPQHWFYFFGVIGTTLAGVYNLINLGSLLTHYGFDEDKAAIFITAMTISELLTRTLIAAFGDCLPCARTLLLPITCALAAAACLMLGLYQEYFAVIIYLTVAGIARGVMFALPYGVAVEVFGAAKSVEVYTSLLVAFGIGGLLGSVVPGLSFDLTGSYTASLHVCAGIWVLCGILYFAVYVTYRQSIKCNTASTTGDEEQTPKSISTSETYATLLNEDVKKPYSPGARESLDIGPVSVV